jgi:hypothetical protein
MFSWLFNWQWARRTSRSDSGGTLEAAKFTIRQGKKYRAVITLTGFETWAGNETIAEKLVEAGFKDVRVIGDGGKRSGEGRWGKPDTTAEIDPHLSEITEVV